MLYLIDDKNVFGDFWEKEDFSSKLLSGNTSNHKNNQVKQKAVPVWLENQQNEVTLWHLTLIKTIKILLEKKDKRIGQFLIRFLAIFLLRKKIWIRKKWQIFSWKKVTCWQLLNCMLNWQKKAKLCHFWPSILRTPKISKLLQPDLLHRLKSVSFCFCRSKKNWKDFTLWLKCVHFRKDLYFSPVGFLGPSWNTTKLVDSRHFHQLFVSVCRETSQI